MPRDWDNLTEDQARELIEQHHVVGFAHSSTGAALHLLLGNGRTLVFWEGSDYGPACWWLMADEVIAEVSGDSSSSR